MTSGSTLSVVHGLVCARKVRLTLAEKGITDWVGHMLDLSKGDQNKPEYLKLNPKGVVPTLVHDGHIITESTDRGWWARCIPLPISASRLTSTV